MSLQLNDQQVLQVVRHLYKSMEDQQNQKLLDSDHLDTFKRKQIKPLYPHKYNHQNGKMTKFQFGQICCQLSSGSTCCACCCNINPPGQVYQQFGLGANIYFNFMRHFSFCFIVLAIISILSVGIAYWIALKNQVNPISNYQIFFFSTTMGSFSSTYMKCKYGTVSTNGVNYVSTYQLSCPQGQIFEFGPVVTQNSQESLTNCKYQRQHYLSKTPQYFINSSSYAISRDASCTKQSCKTTVTFSSQPSKTIVAFPYACVDPSYTLFGKYEIQIRIYTYVFVGIDLFITLGFLFFLCSEKQGEDNQIQYFKQFQLTLKDFSVKLSGFNSKTFDQEFDELLSTISHRQKDFDQRIIQIKTPDNQQYIQMLQNRKQKYGQLFKFMERNFFDDMININQYKNSQDFINNTFYSEKNYIQFKQQLLHLVNDYRNSRRPLELKDKQMAIYLVMNSSSDIGLIKKFRKSFCCSKYLVSNKGNKYSVSQAPIPDMLQWHNKTKWTFIRVIFSWIFTLAIVVASYILFGWIQWEQKQLLSKYNFQINCSLFYNNNSQLSSWADSLYSASPAQYTHCYCSNNYFALNVSDEVLTHCQSWWKNYLLYLLIPLIISVGLVVYNLIVSIIFKKLTQCEGHFYITNEMFSYILKRSFMLIMNMGLIIVLLNFNYNKQLSPRQLIFLFQGQYQDVTSDWYIKIGSIIIMTMIFNISFPFMELFLTSVFKCFRKCLDKRCWTRKTSQKYKSQYISLYSSDVYPIQQRYAIVISIFWITMIFNCVIPALNIIAALSFFLLQSIDKLLVFKFFKKPINFDESLHKKFMKTLYVSIILHLAASAFLLSEPNLVPKGSNFAGISSLNSNNQRVNTLIQTYYIIPYVILFVLLILYGLFKTTIISLLGKCNKKIQRASMYKIRNSQSFLDSLSQYQLKTLKVMTEKQICRLQNLKRQKIIQKCKDNQSNGQYSELYLHIGNTRISNKSSNGIGKNINTGANMKKYESSQVDTQIQIYKRAVSSIIKMIEYHQNSTMPMKAKLIGMPGYEMDANQQQAEKDKKLLQLDSVLEQILLSRR